MFVGYNVDYIVSPLGGDKWLLKTRSKTVIHSVMEQVKY